MTILDKICSTSLLNKQPQICKLNEQLLKLTKKTLGSSNWSKQSLRLRMKNKSTDTEILSRSLKNSLH